MKKLILVFWCLVLVNNITDSQERKIISSDSLLKMFRLMKPFEVLNKVRFENMNFKALYYDTLLKPYLMKWLDKDEYFQYEIERERATIKNNPKLIKEEIQYMLNKQGRKNALDSILNNAALYYQYRDSAIDANVKRFFENHKKEKFNIPDQAIVLHSYLAYPESYTIIKQWWVESGNTMDRSLFISLVRMGDPDARNLYDNKIKKFVKSNGESSDLADIYGELLELRNSFSTMKMIDVLTVDKNYVRLSEGDPGVPYNCQVIKYLLDVFSYKNIEMAPSVKQNAPSKEQLKHLPEIKAAAQKLIEKYKAEEYYWMKNMPFYKGEGTGN